MVSLTPSSLLADRLAGLQTIIRRAIPLSSGTSLGFASVLLAGEAEPIDGESATVAAELDYGGIPSLARAGYAMGRDPSDFALAAKFAQAIERVRGRPTGGREQLGDDDIALLGIGHGLNVLDPDRAAPDVARRWLLSLADENGTAQTWTRRARFLAADLLDQGGRLRAEPSESMDILALDLALRRGWNMAYATVSQIDRSRQQDLMAALLTSPLPQEGDLERAAVWTAALRILAGRAATELVPDVDALVETLIATQSAFRRWVWDTKPNRNAVTPARWLIDNEAHVQSFLWAILEPRFGDQLRDEQYLPGYGQLQPRFDFGLADLKVIVEVKIARTIGDFSKIEEEVAGDTGIYFSDPGRYDRMVAYVYDDCDVQRPEQYDTLRSALRQRDARIIDVVIVRRPGMIPNRTSRGV